MKSREKVTRRRFRVEVIGHLGGGLKGTAASVRVRASSRREAEMVAVELHKRRGGARDKWGMLLQGIYASKVTG